MSQELLGVKASEKNCADSKCPFHGKAPVKPELFTGKIVKQDLNRSATIEWFTQKYVPKYERYEIRRSRMRVHNPGCINAKLGDQVLVAKTRPLSKTKHHVILKITAEAEAKAVAVDIGTEQTEKKKSRRVKPSSEE